MTQPLVYISGRLVPQFEATLPIHDAGIVSGVTVTDFCRTFHHQLYRWSDHLTRFRRDCEACFVPLQLTDEELTHVARDLVAHNAQFISAEQELALITFATPGSIGTYAGQPNYEGFPTLVMHTFPLPFERYRRFFREGISLAVVGEHPVSELVPPRVKHRSRLHWWRADQLVRRRDDVPAGTIALLQSNGLTETAIGNLLLVREGTLYTPPRGTVLDGVSLRVVEELCVHLGIRLVEQKISLEDVSRASEAMLTGTAFCLAGVHWIEGIELEFPGQTTEKLQRAWGEHLGLNFVDQFLSPT